MSIANGEKLNATNWQDFVSRLHDANRGDGVNRHHTADPIFMVQKHETVYGFDDEYSEEKIVHHDDSTWHSPKEYWDDLDDEGQEELNNCANESWDNDFLECEEDEQWLTLGELDGHTVCGIKRQWVNINAHLTREAAEAFIARKQHDYPSLRVYVESMCYGWEYQEIIKGILDGKITFSESGEGQ